MNRLYVAESGLTLTGSMADHRLRLASATCSAFAAALAAKVTGDAALTPLAQGLDARSGLDRRMRGGPGGQQGPEPGPGGRPSARRRRTPWPTRSTRRWATSGPRCEFVECRPNRPPSASANWRPQSEPARSRRWSSSGATRSTTPRPTWAGPSCKSRVAEVVRFGYYVDETSALAGTRTSPPPITSSPGAMAGRWTARSCRSSR